MLSGVVNLPGHWDACLLSGLGQPSHVLGAVSTERVGVLIEMYRRAVRCKFGAKGHARVVR